MMIYSVYNENQEKARKAAQREQWANFLYGALFGVLVTCVVRDLIVRLICH